MSNLPHISEQALLSLNLSAAEVTESIVTMLQQQDQGRAWSAPKSTLLPGDGRYLMSTLAVSDADRLMTVKSLVVNPHNPQSGLPAINSLVSLQDSYTGVPLATLDGNWITAIRTAGLSAVAARYLADPTSSVMAFIGCGVQAQSHLKLFAELFPLTEIRAFGRGEHNRQRLCQSAKAMGLQSRVCVTVPEAMEGADIVVSSVTLDVTMEPFADARWLKPGAFAAITDLCLPWMPEGLGSFDRIVIDDLVQEAVAEQKMLDEALVWGDLGQLVKTQVQSGTGTFEGPTAFAFRGLALGDLALAALAWRRFKQ
ncbi:hypothetical protein MIB92_16375 [Aestuariirhabdus sp. Z084]|uniref:ornithine cyclodeaminase family protein n=1 Tax=Aestuariirhabdus haliotis TaxID=2918751 RepID=UPI00201B437A|nr:hypothetical protein [Aestuariirhabdus haliotis]MCL6417238.1 hypothetical protein [Aestuariirhabdus haliotis]MCL6421197.1 hypothetical protein [Aestuariirhabdus haliotis]